MLASRRGEYGGDFLNGFYLEGAPYFDEWVLGQRARLRELAQEILVTLITHFSDQLEYETAIHYARQALAIEPWHEEVQRELMRLLAFSGQRSAALTQYENCRRLLSDELGAEPGAAMVELYEQIKSGEFPGLQAKAAHRRLLEPALPPHNLPMQTTPFVGRDLELAALASSLADPTIRLITILGPGGMGKTRLALAAAAAQLGGKAGDAAFHQGVFFITLARLETPDQMLPAIAEAVGLRFEAKDEPKEQLLRFLRQKTLLLVLDNFEHLRLGASLLDEMLAAAAGLKLLVTSREKLHLQAEQLFLIGGMTFPVGREQASEELETPLTSFSAIQLFCERAQRAQPGFVLTQANQSHVVEICYLVQGMPLGIVLAAAWLEMLSSQEITAELRQSLDFLKSTMKDVPDRQHSLRAAFNYSWRMLPERERHIFQQLSIFHGGFTRQAAQAITAASLQDLQGLVNKSMLTVVPEGRYEIHELLRQFGAEMLAQAVELETEVRPRHSTYYCSLLHEHTESWHNARQLETFNTHTQEANNVQVAWSRALESGAWLDLLQAIDSLAWYFDWHGRYAEDASTFQRIIEKIEALDDQKEGRSTITERLLAKALAWQGKFATNNHDGLQLFQDAMLVIGRLELGGQDIRREKAFTLFGMGARFNGVDRHKPRQLIEQSLAIYQEIDNSWGTAIGLVALGQLDWGTGHYALAQERLQAGLALHQARGDERDRLAPLNALGWNQKHLGYLEESRAASPGGSSSGPTPG